MTPGGDRREVLLPALEDSPYYFDSSHSDQCEMAPHHGFEGVLI